MTTKVTASVLANTAVTAGTYGGAGSTPTVNHLVPVVTVDAQGRLTSAANVTITNTQVYANSGQLTANTATGVVAVGLATSGAIAGSYGSGTQTPVLTIDAYGRVTSVSATTITGGSAGIGATTYNRQSNTATAGQTVFTVTGGYTVGYLQVYLNGVLLNSGDYTASNGTSFTLGVGATLNDIVESLAYTVTNVLNVSPSPSGGSAGQVLYQSAANTTANTDVGTANYLLTSQGTGKPTWSAQTSLVIANTQITGVITAAQHANTAVTAGTYGGTTQIPVVTIDQQGRATFAANVATSSLTGIAGGFSNQQVFVQNGTFTIPAGITKIKVTVQGGGGGGSGHTNHGSAGGTGGTSSFLLSTTGITCTGGASAGSPGSVGADGGAGGTATVSGEITGSAMRGGGKKGSYNRWREGVAMGGSTPLGTGGVVTDGGGIGAGGGSRTDFACNQNGVAGGSGGYAEALFTVTPTNVWTAVVGGGGGGGGSSAGGAGTNGATVTAGTASQAGGGGGIGAAGGGGGGASGQSGSVGGTPTTKVGAGYSAGGSGGLESGGGGGGGGIVIVEW